MESFSPKLISHETKIYDARLSTDGKSIIWLEGRSDRGSLVFHSTSLKGQRDLTRDVSVRAKVGYGGGDFSLSKGTLFFISEKSLYRQILDDLETTCLIHGNLHLASPAPSPDLNWTLLVGASHETDSLRLVQNSSFESESTPLHQEHDFYMQPTWHPDGQVIAWISWNQPHMPWDNSQLWLSEIDLSQSKPELRHPHQILASERDTYFFQPEFSPCGRFLAFISDEGGWSNLHVLELSSGSIIARAFDNAEHAPPAWVHGMRSFAWGLDSKSLYLIRSRDAICQLFRFDLEAGELIEITGEISRYTSLRQLSMDPSHERISLIGSASGIPDRLLVVDFDGNVRVIKRSSPEVFDTTRIPSPEPVEWSHNGSTCHAVYFPPASAEGEDEGPPPVIIRIHGGPTSQYFAEWDPETHFFTTRGFAVLALNYRGSYGYGRDYRDALKGKWGEIDVEDTRAAYQFLVHTGRGDARKIHLSGGSAGGFTVLLSLCRHPSLFRGAICRYGVSDLFALDEETHRFEAHYLRWLVGPLPEAAEKFKERSPINHAGQIRDPIALFQGADDSVVPRSQSDAMARSLGERGITHIYRIYEGEGHGFRKTETIEDYYSTIEQFLEKLDSEDV